MNCHMSVIKLFLFLAYASTAQARDDEFHQSFRGQSLHPALKLFGPDVTHVSRPENNGLRITLPAKREKSAPVGIAPKFSISGNFEITATYQILNADTPKGGQGVGINLRLIVGSPMREAAGLARYVQDNQEQIYYVTRVSAVGGGNPERKTVSFPTQAKSGKLRLKRTGSNLQFQVAEAADNEFRDLYQENFVTDDCTFRLVAITSRTAEVDVRFLDLQIRADSLPNIPSSHAGGSKRWTTKLLVGVFGLVVVVAGICVWRRRARIAG